eukprot:260591-Rhodomonas_salina.2
MSAPSSQITSHNAFRRTSHRRCSALHRGKCLQHPQVSARKRCNSYNTPPCSCTIAGTWPGRCTTRCGTPLASTRSGKPAGRRAMTATAALQAGSSHQTSSHSFPPPPEACHCAAWEAPHRQSPPAARTGLPAPYTPNNSLRFTAGVAGEKTSKTDYCRSIPRCRNCRN